MKPAPVKSPNARIQIELFDQWMYYSSYNVSRQGTAEAFGDWLADWVADIGWWAAYSSSCIVYPKRKP